MERANTLHLTRHGIETSLLITNFVSLFPDLQNVSIENALPTWEYGKN